MSQTERVNDDEEAGTAGQDRSAPAVIGVLGAGTMGSGIAQLAARAGARTLLHDPIAEALERGLEHARDGLAKEAAKGRPPPSGWSRSPSSRRSLRASS